MLEKIVLEQVKLHLEKNNLIEPFQSAYKAGHCTETALLRITNDLLNAADEGMVSILSLLDLSAAFDT
ncbi:reverse transcriptase-like protein, partial [Elysia marginata]